MNRNYFVLIIILLFISCKSSVKNYHKNLKNDSSFYGVWELEMIEDNENRIPAKKLNDCQFKEKLVLKKSPLIDSYKLERYDLIRFEIGKSKEEICIENPISFQTEVVQNSCPSIWIMEKENSNSWFEIAEGLTIQYEVELIDERLILKTKKVYLSYNNSIPTSFFYKKTNNLIK